MSAQQTQFIAVPTFHNYDEFHQADKALRNEGKTVSDKFLTHVKAGLTLFHGEGNHNIQIVNDLLDTASAIRLPRNRIIDWISALVGHEVVKVEGANLYKFGSKKADTDYEQVVIGAAAHFHSFPSWEEFKREAEPEQFKAEDEYEKIVKMLNRRMKKFGEAGLYHVVDKLKNVVDELKTAEKSETFFVVGSGEEAAPSAENDAEGQAQAVANA